MSIEPYVLPVPLKTSITYPADTLDLEYQGNATDGMKGGFTLTSQFHDVLDKIADKKPLAKHDDEIRKVLGWIFRKDKKKLDESTDLGPLRRRSPLIPPLIAWLSPSL